MEKIDIKGLTLAELLQDLEESGEKTFRGKQIYQWLHQKLAAEFGEMTNIGKQLQGRLAERYQITVLKVADIKVSHVDGTRKYLFCLDDGNVIESVWMKYQHGNSVCISSQAGCRMGCRFCASTQHGLERNLTASEMLDQVYRIQSMTGERVSHVVVMGAGEPLDNYDRLIRFIRLLTDGNGLNISQRNITVSTCGVVPGIRKLANEKLAITLALSLHAPDDKIRRTLMPVAARYPLEEVLAACQEYFQKTGRRLTFEYSLIRGINDHLHEAKALAERLRGMHGHVNLIPVNPIKERDYRESDRRSIAAFKEYLEQHGINVTIRREMGRDIGGACGQLRRSYMEEGGF